MEFPYLINGILYVIDIADDTYIFTDQFHVGPAVIDPIKASTIYPRHLYAGISNSDMYISHVDHEYLSAIAYT